MSTLLAAKPDEIDLALDAFIERPTTAEVFISNPLVTPRHTTHYMIVCGNCAGDERLPRKTLLAADGTCEMCGSRSYILASKLRIPRKGKEPNGDN